MLKAINLRVEYKRNPIGMDERCPRFSFEPTGNSNAWGYRLVVKNEDGEIVWHKECDSHILPIRCNQICYEGKALRKFTRYTWTVQLQDEKKKWGAVSEEAFFETGFFGTPWTGKWISQYAGAGNLLPPQRFLCRFKVTKKIAKARLYTSALGLYEAYINGQNVTEDVFTPGWTDYYHRVQYQAYDVTALIKKGKNMLADMVGEGWFCGRIARNWSGGNVTYGPHGALCQELHLTYADGTKDVIATGDAYRVYCGPFRAITMSDIYMGERYDASEDGDSWKLPDKDEADERTPNILEGENLNNFYSLLPKWNYRRYLPTIEWQSGAPIRRIDCVKPVKITKRAETNTYVVDFGQNLTGRERIRIAKTKQGSTIVIRHGEMLNQDGSLYTANLRGADATTTYLTGNHENVVYEPTFTYYGFRYLEISGWPGTLTKDNIEAQVISSALEKTGDFTCSNPLINKLYSNIVWGQRSNFLDVPTDCPQRDERLGWTGDTQVFANIASYNMYTPEFYTKWIVDLNSTQAFGGGYAHYNPTPYHFPDEGDRFGYCSTGWSDAGIIVPDVMFNKYGDERLFVRYFDNMKKYLTCQVKAAGDSYLVNNACYGDWLNIDDPTDRSLLSTAYLAGMAEKLAGYADKMNRCDDAAELKGIAEAAKEAYQAKFFKNNQLTEKSQTAALLTLHFDLAPNATAYKNVCKALVKSIRETHKLHLSTGFLGTPLLLRVLTKIGEVDLAYDLLQQTTYPSWLYPVTQGATTMWERWNSWNEKTGFGDIHMNSFNHYAYGAVGEWFFETICGIQRGDGNLFDVVLAPKFGKSLQYASAIYHGVYGEIKSAWKRDGKFIEWTITIPCNTRVRVDVPESCDAFKKLKVSASDKAVRIFSPGTYTVKFKA